MENHDLLSHFSIVQGFRQSDDKVKHKLTDILLLTICAVIAGAEGWEEIEDFGHARLLWLREYTDLSKLRTNTAISSSKSTAKFIMVASD